MYEDLFDKVIVDGKEYKGIIDYVTKKNIMFYDFTNVESCAITLLVIIWKTTDPEERFSVFQAKNFPHVNIGTVTILNRKHTKVPLKEIETDEPKVKTKRIKSSPSEK